MVSLLLTSLALLCWPDTRAAARLRAMAAQHTRKRLRHRRPSTAAVLVATVVAGWLVAGLGGAVAAAMVATTARRQLRGRTERRQSLAVTDELAEALRSFVASLRTGAHPAKAAESAAEDAPPHTAATMRAIAAAARLDGDISAVVETARATALATPLGRLAAAWQLAQRHGLPLAEVLDATRRDLEQRARFTRQVLARMAGPQASALTLSLLPVLGIALGEAMGTDPLRLLTTTGAGQALLVAGVALLCAGVSWSARITNHAVVVR